MQTDRWYTCGVSQLWAGVAQTLGVHIKEGFGVTCLWIEDDLLRARLISLVEDLLWDICLRHDMTRLNPQVTFLRVRVRVAGLQPLAQSIDLPQQNLLQLR